MVYLCGYEKEDSKAKFIGKCVFHNVARGMLHMNVIGNRYVSLPIMGVI